MLDKRVWPGAILIGALAAICFFWNPARVFFPIAIVLLAAHCAFFRDPVRKPDGEGVLSPADGKVTEVSFCHEPQFLKGPAVKIGIFLSVLNVHVNRAPWQGKVDWQKHVPGKFLDARHPECSLRNESNWVGCSDGSRKFVFRQISGAIARHIHSDIEEGQILARGQKTGIICYGSRAEVYVPAAEFEAIVQVGDAVKAGKTLIGKWK